MDDHETAWYSETAKFIDTPCSGHSGSSITVRKFILSDAVSEDMGTILGGTREDQAGCWRFAKWAQWAPYVA